MRRPDPSVILKRHERCRTRPHGLGAGALPGVARGVGSDCRAPRIAGAVSRACRAPAWHRALRFPQPRPPRAGAQRDAAAHPGEPGAIIQRIRVQRTGAHLGGERDLGRPITGRAGVGDAGAAGDFERRRRGSLPTSCTVDAPAQHPIGVYAAPDHGHATARRDGSISSASITPCA